MSWLPAESAIFAASRTAPWVWIQAALVLVALLAVAAVVGSLIRRLRKRHTDLSTDLEAVVNERKRAVRALRETEVLYHSLVETLPQSILRKDLDGRFTFANQRFCSELGCDLKEIVGKTDFDFFPRELAEKYRRDDRRVIESGQVLDVVEQHVTPQGDTLYVQVMKSPLFGSDGKTIGIQGIFWDVTARHRAEEQLREQNVVLQELAASEHKAHESEHRAHEELKNTQSRLVQTEKLASLGQLVAGVAHEINNPLSFVSNNVAVLGRDLRDLLGLIELYRQGDTDLREHRPDLAERIENLDNRIDLNYCMTNLPRLIDRTREGLRRIEQIVKELRLFARVDEGDWNEVDLNPGIDSSINMVKGYARKKGVRIALSPGALPPIRCRAARIHQVIVNLLTNAIDACSEDGGLVTVQTVTEPEAMGVRIDIRDNGHGISKEHQQRLFDPFFTTKPVGHGTGLGLSISYGIVQEHGGRIEVQSVPGEGSCFTVHLPLESPRNPAREQVPSLAGLEDTQQEMPIPSLASARPALEVPADPAPAAPQRPSGEQSP